MPKKTETNYKSYFLMASLIMVVSVIYVFGNVRVIKLGYILQQKNDTLSKLSFENDQLKMELSKLTSLEYLDKIAKGKLGLKFPSKDEVVLISES